MTYSTLQRRLKHSIDSLPKDHAIRLHRAISWLKAAEEQAANPDLRFISYWVAFNSCYAADLPGTGNSSERERYKEFTERLARLDTEQRLANLLWHKFSGAVRVLISNQYVYGPFWDYQRGQTKDWKKTFAAAEIAAQKYLAQQNTSGLLQIVLSRLYTLRNQLLHGGATYKSKLNRSQVKDGANILNFILPVIIDIMLQHPEEDWGAINYPPVES